jgi:ABC-type glycerol-3-phosphate transport system substrate-binding protein
MKKKLAIVAILLMVCAMLFAGGSTEEAAGKKKTITIWCAYSQPGRIEAMDHAIAEFQKLNPDIEVVRELVPWANIIQKWTTSSMANSLPQLVVAGDDTMIRLWEAGALESANGAIETHWQGKIR